MNRWFLSEIPRIFTSISKRYYQPVEIEAGDGHPVVVYPGFATGNAAMIPIRKTLRMAEHTVYRWDHNRNTGMSEELVDKLVSQVVNLAEEHETKVSLVGHSLGGTIARVVANISPDHVRRVITIGAPINGIEQSLDRLRKVYDRFNGTNTTEEHWNEYKELVLRPLSVPCTSIFSRTDGIVRPGMSKLTEPLGTNVIVEGGHFSMVVDPEVINVVSEHLNRV